MSAKPKFGPSSRKAMLLCSAAFIASSIAMAPAAAQVLDWDPDPAAGVDGSGSGNWLGADNWTSDNGATNEAWTAGSDAYFGFSGPAANGVVTLNGNTTADQVEIVNGDLTIDGPGVLTAVPGSSIFVSGGQSLDLQAALSGDWTLNNAGTMLLHSGNSVGLNAQIFDTVDNSGTMGGTVNVTALATLNNTGTLGVVTTSGTVNLNAGGDVTGTFTQFGALSQTNVNGATTITGLVTQTAGSMTVDAALTATGGIRSAGGMLDINDTVTGSVEVDGATATLAGTITGGATVSSGTLTVDGASVIGGTGTTVGGGTMSVNAALTSNVVVNGGTYDQNAALTGSLTNAGGLLTLAGDVSTTFTNTASAGLTVVDGASVVGGAVSVDGGTFIVNAELTATGNVSVSSGAFEINDTVNGDVTIIDGNAILRGDIDGALSVGGGSFTVATVASSITGNATVSGGTMNVNEALTSDILVNGTGIYDQNAALTGSVVNNGGTVTVGDDISGTLTNTLGTTTVDGTATVTGLTTLSGGELAVTGALTATGNVVVSGGTLDIDGTVTGDVALTGGAIELAGTVNGAVGLNGPLDTDVLTVDGVSTVTGLVTVTQGDMIVNNQLTASGGVVTGADGDVEIAGTLIGNVESAGDVAIGGTGTLQGNLNNTGGTVSIQDAASITGNVQNSGILITNGTIGGTYTQSGGGGNFSTFGDGATVTGLFTLNGGPATVAAGTTLTLGNGMLVNAGQLAMSGTIANATAAVENDGGTVSLSGTVQGAFTNTSGNTTVLGASTIGGILTVNGGNFIVNQALTVTGDTVVGSGGTLDINTAMTSDVANAGSTTVDAQLTGGLANTGTADINATVTGDVTNAGNGTTNGIVTLAANVGGTFTQASGLTTVDGASTITGLLTVNGGEFVVDQALTASSDITVGSGGTLDINAATTGDVSNAGSTTVDAQLTGGIGNTGTADINATVTGDVTNAGNGTTNGIVTLAANVGGAFTQASGLTTVDGASTITGLLTVNGGEFAVDQTLTATNDVEVNGGLLDIDAQLTGDVTNDGGTVRVDATLLGNLVNTTGTADINGTVDGTVDNSGTLTLAGTIEDVFVQTGTGSTTVDGNSTINGDMSVEDASTFTIADGFTLMVADTSIAATPFASFTNQSLTLGAGSSLTTSPANLGSFDLFSGLTTLGDGSAITAGQVNFDGDVVVLGEHTTTASLIQTASASFDLSTDAATGGMLNLDGDVDFGGTNVVSLDVDLTGGAAAGDLVAITGVATGDIVFEFNDVTPGAYGPERLSILTAADATGLNQTSQAFASLDNTYIYQVVRDGGTGFSLQGDLNPAFLSVLGSINTAQSLVSTIVNRPTSPFTAGSTNVSEDDPCAPGAWGRIVGGVAEVTGSTSTRNNTFSSAISAEYGGIQVGFDNSCFANLYDPSASDLVFGFTAGVNTGNTETPVLDPVTNVTSLTNAEFTQLYAGGYFVMTRSPFTVDLQARYERTEYEFSTAALPSIDGTTVEQDAFTVLGAFTYAVPLTGLTNVVFLPTAGFSLSQSQATVANFSDGTRMEIDDHLTAVGYVSAAFARIVPLVNPNETLSQSLSLTHYLNASSATTATFVDTMGNRTELESDALPNYSELSLGLNYSNNVTIGDRPMTFRAAARLDGRIGGDDFTSTGLTVQFRLQF